MAREAQFVSLNIEWGVELSRVLLVQQSEVVLGVRLVARCARAFLDWSVVDGIVFEERGHVCDGVTAGEFDLFVVATKA